MAHFAQLENNIVTKVIVVANQDILDENGQESEQKGIDFCSNLLGGDWKQTSYNGRIRKNYAGVGYTYDETLDAFVPPKPFPSWTLNEETTEWEAPVARPAEGMYSWDEDGQAWVEVVIPTE